MKITILTYGSRGDVQPFVALAAGLQNAGHTVRLAAPERFAEMAEERRIAFAGLPGSPEEISRRINDVSGAFRMIGSVADYIFSVAGEVARAAFAACDDADVIVHTYLFTTGAHSFARAKGIPDVSVLFTPLFAPTRAFPMPALPNLPAGAASYLSHWLLTQVFWHVGNFGYNRLRGRYPDVAGLRLHWPFDVHDPYPTPLLFAFSPTVLPRPGDWTAPYIHMPGYFFADTPATFEPPHDLAEFLRGGEPPVCVTFGSMVNRQADRIHETVLAALQQTGMRAVILRGWGKAGQSGSDERFLYLDEAPHDWLFPRCKIIVHHGGAGTTAASLRAGVPSITVPHGADQTFWGRRISSIGAGPAPIPVKRLSVELLASALEQARRPALQDRAQDVKRQLCAEDGVANAIRLIEEHAMGFKQFQAAGLKGSISHHSGDLKS